MKKVIKFNSVVLLTSMLSCMFAQAADLAYPNRYGKMAASMVDMMDAFSRAYQSRGGEKGSGGASSLPQAGANWGMTNNPWSSMATNPWSMGSPWSSMAPNPWSMGGNPWSSMHNMPGSFPPNPNTDMFRGQLPASPSAGLDGNWQGRSGELLAVSNGRFRIYQDRDHYQEGRIEVQGSGLLTMSNHDGNVTRSYEYAVHEGKLALRDADGNLLLYRRVP